MNTILSIRLLLITLIIALIVVSCQSPIETPPEINRSVVVRVTDSSNVPMPSIPVEVFRERKEREHISSTVTDVQGTSTFVLSIPQNGGVYTFVAGSGQTGKVSTTANLLCRDTILVFVLGGVRVPCGSVISDTIRFNNVCARTNSGVEFPDSIQRQYCSTCDVPLTINFAVVNTAERLQMRVFDHNSNLVTGNQLTLPPRGCFSVRMIYTPQQVRSFTENVSFTGTGINNANMSLNLTVTGNSVQCNQCACGDSVTIINMGNVVVTTPRDSSSFVSQIVNRNRSQCIRQDRLIKNFSGSAFQLENSPVPTVRPNEGQPVQIRFTPPNSGPFQDSLVYETRYQENNLVCRHSVIVRGTGVQAACCLDVASSSAGLVITTTTPRVDTLHLMARIYQTTEGNICFRNCGTGGTLTVSQQMQMPAPSGFSSSPERLNLLTTSPPGCFTVRFTADTSVVRPNGLGGPAKTRHEADMNIFGCTPQRIHVVVDVDTLPIQFSNCIFRWSQNSFNGYNFTPPEIKGSFVFDLNGNNANMISDFTLISIGAGTAGVRVRSGWTLIRAGVTDQNDFTYPNVRQWTNFTAIKQGPFNSQQDMTMTLFSVYSLRVQRGAFTMYALVRGREYSTDGQKEKICFDVLFPM